MVTDLLSHGVRSIGIAIASYQLSAAQDHHQYGVFHMEDACLHDAAIAEAYQCGFDDEIDQVYSAGSQRYKRHPMKLNGLGSVAGGSYPCSREQMHLWSLRAQVNLQDSPLT